MLDSYFSAHFFSYQMFLLRFSLSLDISLQSHRGNSAHVLIPFLGETNHNVNLMTRRPNDWDDTVTCEVQNMSGEVLKSYHGKIQKKSSDPADVIPDADIIVLCMPVHQYRDALFRLAPYIDKSKKEVFVGTIFGQAGFNWMVHEMEKEFDLSNTVAFAVGLIPWICRTEKYGSLGYNYGGKQVNIAAVTPHEKFDRLKDIFLDDICYKQFGSGRFVQACSFISLSLSVDNQIIHPGRCYGLWQRYGGKWKTYDEVPFFYKDFDQLSADCVQRLDDDYTTVRNAICQHFPDRPFKYMLDYLALERLTHKSSNNDTLASLKDSQQLGRIKTPTEQLDDGTYMLAIHSRFFTDDIPYGILIAKWIAEQLNVEVPFIDEVINWAQDIRGDKFLTKDNKIDLEACLKTRLTSGIPPAYGITSVEDILD